MDPSVIQSIILLILVLLSAFFSSSETALTTVNRVRMRSLAEDGNRRAATVNKILDQYSKMLSAILIGNNIVNLSASALATTLAIRVSVPVGIATGILTFIILVCGEVVPKTWAILNSEKLALLYSGIIYGLMQCLTPLIFIVDNLSLGILRLFHVDPSRKNTPMTEDDLRTYVDVSHEDGVIQKEERKLIYNVFDFSDAVAKDIMIPRIDMVTVGIDDSYDKVLGVFRESMYTRLPVYQDDKDNIIGLINIKDFILAENAQDFRVENILRKAHYTYEFKKVPDLLLEIREKTTNVTFVLDEYGATVGMLTLEDLLEEIVGEIRDEYDADEEELIQEAGDRAYLVEASMKLDDINEALGTELDSQDYDSIGGILIESLNRLPEDGEEVTLENGIRLQVKGIEKNRISKVLMTLPVPETEQAGPQENTDTPEETAPETKSAEPSLSGPSSPDGTYPDGSSAGSSPDGQAAET